MSPPRPSLGVAVIGLGVGEAHARAYANLPGCEIRWLYDVDGDRATALAGALGQGRPAPDYEAILRDPEVSIVSIASYDDAHVEQVLGALEAGKHVFVEKPLCRTASELRAVKRAWCQHSGRVKLYSNLVLRAAPVYRWLRQSVAQGLLGEPYAFDVDYLYGRLHKITEGWRRDILDYSVIEGGGIHLLDLMLWLLQERPVRAYGSGNRICTRDTAFRYDDYACGTLEFPSGVVARVSANFGCVHPHQHVLRLFGTAGTFLIDDSGPRLYRSRVEDASAARIALSTLPASKGELVLGFVRAVEQDVDITSDTQSFFDGIAIAIACDQARQAHTLIDIDYP